MIDRTKIDFGVLDPATTEVAELDGSYHILLRSEKGKEGDKLPWPYRPEVLQRRSGNHRAALAVTLVLPIHYEEHIRTLGQQLDPRCNFFKALELLKVTHPRAELHVLLLKMLRPAAPAGVEWNAPGGVLEAREDPQTGMVREFREEVRGLRVLGSQILFPNVQFGSGVYREYYDIGAVLAHGSAREPNRSEGILESTTIPLAEALPWMDAQNQRSTRDPEFCGVDGKVLMAIERLNRELLKEPIR